MHRSPVPVFAFLIALAALPSSALAQGGDLTIFVGGAYPIDDDRLTLRPSAPVFPGVDVGVSGSPELKTDGGLVFGGALAFEIGVFGIEGRVDATKIGFDLTGARYDLEANAPPFQGLTAQVTVADGRFDVERLYLLSLNARLRTPGPVGFVVSGGLSYLPTITITGSVPVTAAIGGAPPVAGPDLSLGIAQGESKQRFGVNGGGGLRFGGGNVALQVEARVFYFKDYELRFRVDESQQFVNQFLESLDPIRFDPIIINAQAGLVIKF